MSQEAITILDRRTGQPVEAILHTDLDSLRLVEVEIVWSPERLRGLRQILARSSPGQVLPQHVHWNWAMKALGCPPDLVHSYFGIEAGGNMQGLMKVSLGGHKARLPPDKGKPLVYVDFLETAPWNSREFGSSSQYGGVGRRLIQVAARLNSDDDEFGGRVGLHSLPQSRGFYVDGCGMVALGPDASYEGLEYFELTAAQAAELLKD